MNKRLPHSVRNDETKIAIVHDILDRYGGAEKVVEGLIEAFPQADLFVSRYTDNPQIKPIIERFAVNSSLRDNSGRISKQSINEIITQSRQVGTTHNDDYMDSTSLQHSKSDTFNLPTLQSSFMQKLPFFKQLAKLYTPLYPLAFESFDLRSYDVVISSTAHFAKAVITSPHQLHICYCHTPPRFLYHYPTESSNRNNLLFRPFVRVLDHLFRQYDFKIAHRPDIIIANSENTAKRIRKLYRREPRIIYPLVDVEMFRDSSSLRTKVKQSYDPPNKKIATVAKLPRNDEDSIISKPFKHSTSNYYIFFSRLLPYKKVDVIVTAFNQLGEKLIIIGDGSQKLYLQSIAKENIEFKGFVNKDELVSYIRNAQAFVFNTPDEDFGIVMVESLAAGTPVIAVKGGGVLEIVQDGVNGVLYDQPTLEGVIAGVQRFKEIKDTLNKETIVESAQKFGKERFIEQIKDIVEGWQVAGYKL
jgi:glycosyltransferase involved in cell wall biosynthesis